MFIAAALFGVLLAESLGLFQSSSAVSAVSGAVDRTLRAGASQPGSAQSEMATAASPSAIGADAETPGSDSDLIEQNLKLKEENRDLQNRMVAILNWILANFRGKYPLPETYMSKLQITPVTEDFKLHPDAAKLFKVTPVEEGKINDVLAYAEKYLADIESAIITVTNPRPDKFILHIPTFTEEGKKLQEDLYAALEITLGPDRFDRFLTVTEPGLKSSFGHFGEASRTMIFELVYENGENMPRLQIKDGWVVEVGPETRQITAEESTVTNLPSKYIPYMAWMPEYVGSFPVARP